MKTDLRYIGLSLLSFYSEQVFFTLFSFRIEQELGTEIKPIPKVIDKSLYVAEYQQEEEIPEDN